MDAGLLDVLHHGADAHRLAVAQGVHVDLDRVLQEPVQEDVALGPPALGGALQVAVQRLAGVTDLHRAPAEHVRGTHQERVAHLLRGGERLLGRGGGGVGRALEAQLVQDRAEAGPVLGQVDRLDRRAQQRHAGVDQPLGQLQRRLAAELHDHALGLLQLDHAEHVLQRQRLEVQPVRGVVVGGDRLRVAVDHDRVAARRADGHRGVHAAVVELDALADPVRARAQDDHRGVVATLDLVSRAVGPGTLPARVEVRRGGLELGRARVHRLVGAHQPLLGVLAQRQVAQLVQVPGVDAGARVQRGHVVAAPEGLEHQLVAVPGGDLERGRAAPRRRPAAWRARPAHASARPSSTPA